MCGVVVGVVRYYPGIDVMMGLGGAVFFAFVPRMQAAAHAGLIASHHLLLTLVSLHPKSRYKARALGTAQH